MSESKTLIVLLYDSRAKAGKFLAQVGNYVLSYHPALRDDGGSASAWPDTGGVHVSLSGSDEYLATSLAIYTKVDGTQNVMLQSLSNRGDDILDGLVEDLSKLQPALKIKTVRHS